MEYKIGMIISGKITGIQPYGAFVSLDGNHQGLIHVSEVKHGFIKNISEELEIGQEVTVKVIDIDEYTKKISLSLRVLQETPPAVYRKKKYFTNKNKKIGFASIEERLDKWTQDALKETLENN
ncbi:CvfD/Ygs/GSP13 family RNA-binding post-transcriptional regulator [Vagococcus carniphilus]|uniref:RNA-binding protein n=1 Tax=Vagococcus carniphilus TaxID=218144 RepID=A0A430B8H1_9ENTE|nr:CvfD/Ygs/GSP13 family RNA-binding post-transcriptional regulator [Vagococcus carniphilus]QNN73865.1 S1 RNA-binding domain-containing protein [Vagococcus carniphilus]RSU16605.1 RNA-binding protein [Vagococcus carniphilus]